MKANEPKTGVTALNEDTVVTGEELARLLGISMSRLAQLTALGYLQPAAQKEGENVRVTPLTDDMIVTAEDLARVLSISTRRLAQLAEAGHVARVAHGRYLFRESVLRYLEYIAAARRR